MKYTPFSFILIALSAIYANFAYSETIKVGANIPSAPFVYFDEKYKAIGFDIDLLAAIGKEMNFEIEVVQDDFPRIFDTLKTHKIDIIANVYYSKEREADYGLSTPYYTDKLRFLAPKDTVAQNFLQENTNIYVLSFSPIESTLKAIQSDYSHIEIVPRKTTWLSFKALFQNRGSVLLTSDSSIQYFKVNYPNYHYETFDVPNQYPQEIALSWLFRKEDNVLKARINQGLEKVKASGKYDALKTKYYLP